MQYPTLSASSVRHLEVVALTPARLLLVVITDTGRVDQRIVELGDAIDDHQLGQLRDLLGQALEGKPLAAASIAVADLAAHLDGHGGLGDAIGRSATVLLEIAGRAHRGASAAGRHRQPDPQHRRLRRVVAVGARSARGAGRGAASCWPRSRRPVRSRCVSDTRPRPSRWPVPRWSAPPTAVSGKVYGGMGVLGSHSNGLSGNDRQCRRGCSVHRRSLGHPLGVSTDRASGSEGWEGLGRGTRLLRPARGEQGRE